MDTSKKLLQFTFLIRLLKYVSQLTRLIILIPEELQGSYLL